MKSHSLNIMKERLFWNFEIHSSEPIYFPDPNEVAAEGHWEARFFWPCHQPILISGLDDSFLELSHFKFKHRLDEYLLLKDRSYNFKIRNDQIVYKPKIAQTTDGIAYGKKIKFSSYDEVLPPDEESMSVSDFRDALQHETVIMAVEKEAAIYKFSVTPKVSIEFARVKLGRDIVYSLCIESKVKSWVNHLNQIMLGGDPPKDYIEFLKSYQSGTSNDA